MLRLGRLVVLLGVLLGAAVPHVARAAPVSVAPSDGTVATGPAAPSWGVLAAPVRTGPAFAAVTGELEAAWGARRSLENEAARTQVDALIGRLRPTLDAGQRDLLQRALFLRGVLDADDAGGLDRVSNGVDVDGQWVPRAWVEAISVSPGARAPSATDADFAVQVYEQVRTRLVAREGIPFDPSTRAPGEVRVDGATVRGEVTLLPGRHTVSWHAPGEEPVALVVDLPDDDVVRELRERVDAAYTGATLPAATAALLRDHYGTPAVLVDGEAGTRVLWLVDGPARWGAPKLGVGVSGGAWMLAVGGAPTPDRCGTSSLADSPTKVLVPGSAEVSLGLGPWRATVGGGVSVAAAPGDAFAVAGDPCANGVPVGTDMQKVVPWGWASVGRRFALGPLEIVPFIRGGTLAVYGVAEVGVGVRPARLGPLDLELRVHGGAAFNTWSGEGDRAGFLGGLDTALVWRAR